MKLFKSLLVAPATLGLLAPLSATANEVTINDFSPAEELAVTSSRVDGLEAQFNNFEAGSFSETTTASFSADFLLGATDSSSTETTATGLATDNDFDDALQAGYSFQIDLNTSFTGEDSLDISIDAGNAAGLAIAEFDGNSTGDALQVDGVSYSFPLGDFSFIVGDNTDGSALFTTACSYGGPSNTLDDCGNVNAGITNGGAMAGAAYDFGNGFTVATGWAGPETQIAADESLDAYGFNGAYTGDNYGLSITYGVVETGVSEEDTFTAFNGYYTPDLSGFPSISVGYEIGEDDSVTTADDSLTSYFVGLSWDEVGPGSAGVAMGTKTPTVQGTDEALMYEAYYSYSLNDGVTITPLIYIKEFTEKHPHSGPKYDEETGVMVKTSFSF